MLSRGWSRLVKGLRDVRRRQSEPRADGARVSEGTLCVRESEYESERAT